MHDKILWSNIQYADINIRRVAQQLKFTYSYLCTAFDCRRINCNLDRLCAITPLKYSNIERMIKL